MSGLFITFEGTEGGGKSTQIVRLAERLATLNLKVRQLREPGGTPIGEEIRHLLKHSDANHAMTAETELLLINASRAQLVQEEIRPALAVGEIVLCDRFYDSTTAYQGYGRGLNLNFVESVISFAVSDTRPNLTLLLMVPVQVSEQRRLARQQALFELQKASKEDSRNVPLKFDAQLRDRMEEADRSFFERVERGYHALAAAEPARVKTIDATRSMEEVGDEIWRHVRPLLEVQLAAARR